MHQRRIRSCVQLLRILNRKCSTSMSNEYTVTPEYPPILDLSPKEELKRERAKKVDKINNLHTVEEKLFALNMDKYYGWNCLILKEHVYPYQFLPFVKFITRTYSVQDKDQFHKVQNVDVNECKVYAENIRSHLQEAILFAVKGKKKISEDETPVKSRVTYTSDVIESMNSVLMSFLSPKYSHLLESMVDYKPRIEAFWNVGSFQPSDEKYNERKEKKDAKDEELSELVEHYIQYLGKPLIQLRSHHLLPQLETQHLEQDNGPENTASIPLENADPSLSFGLEFQRRHGTNIPGFWPGDKNEFALLSYHDQEYLLDRPPHFGNKEFSDTLLAQAILSSYAWLHGIASYQGFSTFTDVTYPLVTQNIITDGRHFTFSLYQMNTTLLHSEHSMENKRVNLCLSTPTSQLYQEINGNEFIGWNDDLVSKLVSLYINVPKEREGIELKPFVNSNEKYLSEIEEEEARVWWHSQFRHMYSNRPRHLLPYEIYDWERIYKIKFSTRYLEPRMRPFEHDQNPLEDRKYNDHRSKYVPKMFRPKKKHWAGWRAKFAKTYYPDV